MKCNYGWSSVILCVIKQILLTTKWLATLKYTFGVYIYLCEDSLPTLTESYLRRPEFLGLTALYKLLCESIYCQVFIYN